MASHERRPNDRSLRDLFIDDGGVETEPRGQRLSGRAERKVAFHVAPKSVRDEDRP